MANYATLKAAIQNVVKTNRNNEITGALLQQTLLTMVNSLGAGYQYMGVATPTTNPGTPDQNVFYFASTAGTYTNFGGLVLADGEIAILKYNGAWSKDSTGAATAEQVSQLGQKVDDLSTGKYYGYFAKEEDLPEADVDGFAYVGEGPTYTIYNLRGGVWTSSEITVNQSPIGNDEDIDQNEDGKLQFANRPNTDGMGYVILRKDKTFAEQVTEENTIYEIRYDFTLGEDITIPANCVLEFDGGSLSGGTLIGDNYIINSCRKRIFHNVKFEGEVAKNAKFYIDWWVSKFSNGVILNSTNIPDAYPEINDAVNSGVGCLVFSSDKYYYIKQTIVVNEDDLCLLSDNEINYNGADRSYREPLGCIYSNEVITLLAYYFKTRQYRGTLSIGRINFCCTKPFSSLVDRDTPIVAIYQRDSVMTGWGFDIACNIKAHDREIDISSEIGLTSPVNRYVPSYTGLKIVADGGNLSFVRIKGYIQMVYKAISLEKSSGYWFTDVEIFSDTRACVGGTFAVAPIKIYGSHQPISAFPVNNQEAYFTGSWLIFNGFVWDTNTGDSQVHKVRYPINISGDKPNFSNIGPGQGIKTDKVIRSINVFGIIDNILRTKAPTFNFLNNLITGNQSELVSSWTYKINNIDILNLGESGYVLYNSHVLFGNSFKTAFSSDTLRLFEDTPYLSIPAEVDSTNIAIELNFKQLSLDYSFPLYIKFPYNDATVKIKKNGEIIATFNSFDSDYYTYGCTVVRNFYENGATAGIVIEITTSRKGNYQLPLISLPGLNMCPFTNGGPTSRRPNFYSGQYHRSHKGFTYFDTTLGKPIYWTGTAWVDATGTPVNS